MTGATIKALDPVIADQGASGRLAQSNAGYYNNFHHLAGRLHVPDASGHEIAAGEHATAPSTSCCGNALTCSRSSTRRLTRWPGSSWKSTPTTSNSRRRPGSGPRPPSGWKPSVPTTRKAGSRSTGSSTRSASMPRPWRPGGPVQDDLQHLDRRSRGSQGNVAGLRQHRRGRGPASAEGLYPGPRHPGRTPQAADSSRRSDVSPASHGPAQSRPRPGQPAAGRATG